MRGSRSSVGRGAGGAAGKAGRQGDGGRGGRAVVRGGAEGKREGGSGGRGGGRGSGGSGFVACPVCWRSVPLRTVSLHVDSCLAAPAAAASTALSAPPPPPPAPAAAAAAASDAVIAAAEQRGAKEREEKRVVEEGCAVQMGGEGGGARQQGGKQGGQASRCRAGGDTAAGRVRGRAVVSGAHGSGGGSGGAFGGLDDGAIRREEAGGEAGRCVGGGREKRGAEGGRGSSEREGKKHREGLERLWCVEAEQWAGEERQSDGRGEGDVDAIVAGTASASAAYDGAATVVLGAPGRGRISEACTAAAAAAAAVAGRNAGAGGARKGDSERTAAAGEAGTGEAGKGEAGTGEAGKGEAGTGEAGKGEAGTGEAGKGEAGTGEAGKGEAGTGEAGKGEAGTGEAGKGEAGTGEAGMGEAVPPRLAWDVFSRGRRQHKVIYLIRHGHTSFYALPSAQPLPPPPLSHASHLSLAPSALSPSPLLASPRLLPFPPYRRHLCRDRDVPLSPLGRQQATALYPSLMHIAHQSQLLLVSPLSRALETLCYALHLNTPHPPCCTSHGPQQASPRHPASTPCLCPAVPPSPPGPALPSSPPPCPVLVCALHSEHVAGPGDMGREKEVLASDFPLPFLSFSHLQHHWWPYHPSHPPPTHPPHTPTAPAITAAPSPAATLATPGRAPSATLTVAATLGASSEAHPFSLASRSSVSLFSAVTPPVAGTVRAPAPAGSNPPPLHEPRAVLRKRVGEFRRFLSARPEATITVIGHSTFFMEFLASRRRMKHCEIVKMCL
ncbi:hypothetical protein CLOP_g10506 [Closterium sp. NIES-67]|nr:hypothetical protein CLOP_g10506 [Closterium sp. NIES-67]